MKNSALQVMTSGSKKALSLLGDKKNLKKRRLVIGLIFFVIIGVTFAKYWRWYHLMRTLRLI